MSGRAGHRKRLICLTAQNLRSGSLPLSTHADFFWSPDAAKRKAARATLPDLPVELEVDGFDERIKTVVEAARSNRRGAPRFRDRGWIRRFFELHGLAEGDTVSVERRSDSLLRVAPFESRADREGHAPLEFRQAAERTDAPTVIELFAGCGGMALGFKRAGFQTVLANEWDRDACETLRRNVSPRVSNCAIQEIAEFPRADVVAGGPPCQGFSNLGERVPNDPRNQLWRQYMRCVEQARPSVFVLENVPPLLKSAEYQELLKIGRKLGYQVEGRVLNAADYGVPQTRKRAIVIGSRIGLPVFPQATHVDPNKRDLLSAALERWKTVRDTIAHLPRVPDGQNWHLGRDPTPKSMARYRSIPEGGNRWDIPTELLPDCWIRKTEGGTDLMGRLWWDRPSVTIRTEFYKPEKGRYLHPSEHRPITHLEASLLQSFPADFHWHGSKISVGRQIGNAVPPVLAQAIARAVLQALQGLPDRQLSASGVA